MYTGTVRWFNPIKKYGFIMRDDGKADVFFHETGLSFLAPNLLTDGQKVSFDIEIFNTTSTAVNITLISPYTHRVMR